jgi:hypothetical protein
MLVVATETFFYDGGLIRPNQKLEVSASVANDLMVGGFVKNANPQPLNVETDIKKKESSSVSQVVEVLPEQTVKKSRTGKKKNPTDL